MGEPGRTGKVEGCLDGMVRALVLLMQAAFAFLALVCLFGIVVQVADEGGGASGPARKRVTIAQRVGVGLFDGALGATSAVVFLKLGDARRRIGRAVPEVGATDSGPRIP